MMYLQDLKTEVVVVGGGAAGMLSAIVSARRGIDTILIEKKDRIGSKLRITGKGRCNITNDCEVKEFLTNIPVNPKFLQSALHKFKPRDAMAFFEEIGVPLKTERGARVFPVSDKAQEVCTALEKEMQNSSVKVLYQEVLDIEAVDGEISAVVTDGGKIECRNVILCTGGLSYPVTGSTGDGYKFAEKFGHNIVRQQASLVPLLCEGKFCRDMMGLTLKNVRLSIFDGDKKVFSDFGEMLFTHFGISGPLVLSASAHMKDSESGKYRAEIDLKPALDEQMLDKRLLSDFDKYKNSDFINSLGDLFPRALIPIIAQLSGIDFRKKVNSITKDERKKLSILTKAFPLKITGTRPVEEAVITSGGVDVKEINPRTMQSTLLSGLYFAGEIIDTDGYTGGFNLQIAWSTAFVAGNSVN